MGDLWLMNWSGLVSPADSQQQPLGLWVFRLGTIFHGGGAARIHNETTHAVSSVVDLTLLCKGRRSN